MISLCPDCGRDLDELREYRDWVHYIPGTDRVCLEESSSLSELGKINMKNIP